jgi:hypothetical protein
MSVALFRSLPPKLRALANDHRLVRLPLAPAVRQRSYDRTAFIQPPFLIGSVLLSEIRRGSDP